MASVEAGRIDEGARAIAIDARAEGTIRDYDGDVRSESATETLI